MTLQRARTRDDSLERRESTHFVLTQELLEQLTDRNGKPRLSPARAMLLDERNLRDIGFQSLEEALGLGEELFSYWRDFAEYILLEKNYVGRGKRESQYLAVKCSKRGNDVYQRRIKLRLGWLNEKVPEKSFFTMRDFQVDKKVSTSLLWITLTCDPSKKRNLRNAWETLGEDFNRFVSALKSHYGKLYHFRVWESYESGYPHIHAVVFFEEARFTVFPHVDSENKLTFRISEKAAISELWHSFVDIQAISSLRNVFTYLKKHQEKVILGLSGSIQEGDGAIGFNIEDVRGLRTLFLCWIFRKRSFSVSGAFREKLADLISHLRNSNKGMQLDFEGNAVREWVYVFLGVFSAVELGIPPFIWTKRLSKEKITEILSLKSSVISF